MERITLQSWLGSQPPALAAVVLALARACIDISEAAALGPLADLPGAPQDNGTHGEVQKKLDVYADDCVGRELLGCKHVAAWASEKKEEEPTIPWQHAETGEYLVVFVSLGGSPNIDSNIESNIGLGTVFSLLPHPFRGTTPGSAGFLQPGRKQVAAGYVVYGPATAMILSCGQGVAAFTLDRRSGEWVQTRDRLQVPAKTSEFAIDVSNQRFWEKPIQRYVAECLSGEAGPRARDFNMRWVASLVAEVHRVFAGGGVFMVPRDTREPRKPGHLRLLYEAAPMGYLMEQAGAAAVTGTQPLLDIVPDTLHQKVPAILGSRDEVVRIVEYHEDQSENVNLRLFKTRSLFVQPQS